MDIQICTDAPWWWYIPSKTIVEIDIVSSPGNLSWRGCRQSAQEAMESRKTPSESSLPTMGLYFVVYQLEATHRGHYAFRLLLSHVIRTTLFSVRWHRSLSIFLYQRPVAGFMVPYVQEMWIALRDTGWMDPVLHKDSLQRQLTETSTPSESWSSCRVLMWWNLTIDIHPIIWCEIHGLNGEMIMRGYAKEIYRKTRFCFYFQFIIFSTTDLLLHTNYFCTDFL